MNPQTSIFSPERNRFALVMGQTDYQFMDKLPSAVLDAQLMNRTLKNIGFTTTVLTNKTNEELNTELKEFSKKVKNNDIVFLYYSGHAMQQTIQSKTDNHLFGIDAKGENVDGVKLIKGVALLGKIFYKYFIQNCIYLVVVDACRKYPKEDEKIKSGFTNNPGEMTLVMDCLAEDIKQRQIDFVYACQPGYGANEPEEGEVGYLAKALSIALSKTGTWTEALVQAIKQVQKDTNDIQLPAISLNVGEQIFIKPLGLLLREIPQKLQPQINEKNLQKLSFDKFEQSAEKGTVANQYIEIGGKVHINLKRNSTTLIKNVVLVNDYAVSDCAYIYFNLYQGATLQIEDCVCDGIGLYITTFDDIISDDDDDGDDVFPQLFKSLKYFVNDDERNNINNINNEPFLEQELFHGYKAIVNRVKIINAPQDGLSISIKFVQIENVISQNCQQAGIESRGVTDLNIQKCFISDCRKGLSIFNTNFFARNIDVCNCKHEAFDFKNCKGVLKDSGFGECSVGISECDWGTLFESQIEESQIKYENIQLLDEQ